MTTAKDGQALLRAAETRFAVLPICKALRFFSALFGSPGTEIRRQTGFIQSQDFGRCVCGKDDKVTRGLRILAGEWLMGQNLGLNWRGEARGRRRKN